MLSTSVNKISDRPGMETGIPRNTSHGGLYSEVSDLEQILSVKQLRFNVQVRARV